MTREEAAMFLKDVLPSYMEHEETDEYHCVIEAINMAIQTLEAQDSGTTEDVDDIYAIMKDYYFEHKDEHDDSWQNGFGKCMNLIPNVFEKKTPLEPCEDCISRAAAIKTLQKDLLWTGSIVEAVREDSIDLIKKLSPVISKPRIGEWKWTSGELNKMNCSRFEQWTCSCCGMRFESKSNFCPYCGAKMEGEKG